MLMMNEPGQAKKTIIRKNIENLPDISTTVWDRWEVKADNREFTLG
jgi:hypothetical protein